MTMPSCRRGWERQSLFWMARCLKFKASITKGERVSRDWGPIGNVVWGTELAARLMLILYNWWA